MHIEVRLAHGFVESQQGGRLVGSRYAARLAWNEGRTLSPTKIQQGKPVPCPDSTLMIHTHKTRAGRLTRSSPCFCDVCLRRCALSPALANFSSHFTSQPAREVPNPQKPLPSSPFFPYHLSSTPVICAYRMLGHLRVVVFVFARASLGRVNSYLHVFIVLTVRPSI